MSPFVLLLLNIRKIKEKERQRERQRERKRERGGRKSVCLFN